jgi:hypothetical protein
MQTISYSKSAQDKAVKNNFVVNFYVFFVLCVTKSAIDRYTTYSVWHDNQTLDVVFGGLRKSSLFDSMTPSSIIIKDDFYNNAN